MLHSLRLPKYYDKEQMWNAVEMMNKGSYTYTAKLQRTLHQAWENVREATMQNLEPPREIEMKLPDNIERMPQVERAIALVINEQA